MVRHDLEIEGWDVTAGIARLHLALTVLEGDDGAVQHIGLLRTGRPAE